MRRYIDDNFNLHAWKIPAQTGGMKVVRSQNLTYVNSGLPCDTFNLIHITNGQNIPEAEIEQAISHFKQQHFPYCIWLSSENLTAQVKQTFSKNHVLEKGRELGMILDLAHYQPQKNEGHKNSTIVRNRNELADYAAVIASNWKPPDETVLHYFKKTDDRYPEPGNKIILLVYYENGTPVSTVELFPTDEAIIGVYSLATLYEFRGKGIGSAMMTVALNTAKERGYKTVVLQASEDGKRIYERLGFKTITHYFEYA